jgi:hypothetical protein
MKTCWITPHILNKFSLSIESNDPENDYNRVLTEERIFPAVPSPDRPLRHVIILKLFSRQELLKLAHTIIEELHEGDIGCCVD